MLGFFRKLIGRGPEPAQPAAVSLRRRDCHSHVVPGVDDGSRDLDESLAMLHLLAQSGAEQVVATPHIFPARFPNEPDPLRRRFEALQTAAFTAEIPVALELGAEHYLDDTLLDRIKRGDVLCFGPERYVLFETSTGAQTPVQLMPVVHELAHRGYTPLVAHVERYHYLRGEEGQEILEDLRFAGACFQVNRTIGKVNVPGKGPRGQFIAKLLQRGWIDEVGSDLHRATPEGRPYPTPAPAAA